ncbi:T-box protein 12-like [Ostrea edulis]|uniref:T-box protein 12-like n=1 Tax=Ostrea edulis TaxID=37623 RepID=UPI0024AE8ED8|nr:T-box protein 12-like [Ostrea edulis]
MENHATSFQNRDCRGMKQPEVLSGNNKTPDKRIPSNASSSSSDMEVQLSDVDVYQMYANSNSSEFSEMQSSSSEAEKSKDGIYDDKNNCIPLINGSIVLSLMEAKMWHKFLELGTEMIINRSGRRMFPYVEFFLKGVDPAGLYDVMFDIIPASSKSFKFLNNKWIPIGKKDEEFRNHPFKHPDSPRIGSDWMSRKISFEKIKLSNKPDTKDGIFTLHTFQKYFVCIYIVKHEEDDKLSVMDFPIRATTFIAVTAYNNRKVTKLKINSNPYSKGFRFPVKRGPLDLSIKKDSRKTKGEYEKDKEAQTDITIGDAKTWFSFLGYPLADKSADMALSFFHMFPYLTRKMREQDVCSDGQRMGFPERYPEFKSSNQHSNATAKAVNKENNLQSTEREREMRKERLKEYNTRIEMWKRDKEDIYPDNPKQMKNSW